MTSRYQRIGVIVLVVALLVVFERSRSNPAGAKLPSGAAQLAKTPGLGDQQVDGKLAFKLGRVDCDVTFIGTRKMGDYGEKGDRFCVVSVDVTDSSDDEVDYYDAWQHAYSPNGATYSVDTDAASLMPTTDKSGTRLNPNESILTELPFLVPKATTLSFIDFHEDAFSQGVLFRV